MHGKIAIYMDSTGRGTVVNVSNMFFDFNLHSWNDKRNMPCTGMLVEFRCDGKNATTIYPSRFQEFKEGDFITENDFFKTDNDDELEDLQQTRRGNYITELFRSTDYDTIKTIPLSFTIPQAIQQYFSAEILSVEALKSNVQHEKEIPCVLDYFIIKPYLNKALTSLIFMDSSIDQRQFSSLKSIIMHLEYSYKDIKSKSLSDIKKIFHESFLSSQCHYQALVATIDTYKNRAASLGSQTKNLISEINYLKNNPNADPEKLKQKEGKLREIQKEVDYYQTSLKRLEAIQDDFYKKNLGIFENAFNLSRQKLFDKIATGINLCATIIDIKIWRLSLKSSGIKNSYFIKSNIENSFCSLSFAEHYLSHLNKSMLNRFDQRLLAYVQKITKEQRKNYLVVTSDPDFLCKIKLEIFSLNPYYLVKYASKKVSYQSLMRDNIFDIVYIDEKHIWESAADIILEGKYFDKSGETKFKLR